jgi:YcaO-like protein with predicted kinase domain
MDPQPPSVPWRHIYCGQPPDIESPREGHTDPEWLLSTVRDTIHKHIRQGTYRCIDPHDTLVRLHGRLPGMGITRIADVTGLDRIGVPVALAVRPNSRSLAVSQGKGLSPDAAKASAVMESIELYHAERIRLPLRLASYEELCATERVVDVDQLPQVKDGLFHKHRRLLWVEGYDLLQHENVWVPYEMVSTDFTLPFPEGYGCFPPNSNGLASGNTMWEAISHGICEVVERDAITLWSLRKPEDRCESELDLDSVTDKQCRYLLEFFSRAGVAVRVWDVTSDVGLACFRCLIAESNQDPLHFGYAARGFGCHPSRPLALIRALTEAAQARLTYIAGSRDDVSRAGYRKLRNPGAPPLSAEPTPKQKRDFSCVPDYCGDSLGEDLRHELGQLRQCGISRVVVVNLTRDELRIPVAKVVIPGLEGVIFEVDYAPGRRALRQKAGPQ